VVASGGFDELCGNAHMAGRLADAALEHVAHAQFTPDLFYVDRAAFVDKRAVAFSYFVLDRKDIGNLAVVAIEPQLYAAERFRIQRKPPESLDAWECVIRAMSLSSQATLAGFTAAEELCRRAIALAPD
jgi:hypothetical protein